MTLKDKAKKISESYRERGVDGFDGITEDEINNILGMEDVLGGGDSVEGYKDFIEKVFRKIKQTQTVNLKLILITLLLFKMNQRAHVLVLYASTTIRCKFGIAEAVTLDVSV